jgi:eukaryotic-like serine/threonine-protein kinase
VFFSRDERGGAHAAAATLGPPSALASMLSAVAGTAVPANRSGNRDANQPVARNRTGDNSGDGQSRVEFANAEYVARGTSLSTAGGDVVGGFLVLRTQASAVSGLPGVRGPLLVAMSVGLLVALMAALAAARFVTRPVRALSNAITRVADGDLTQPLGLVHDGAGVREIRELASAFESLIGDLRDKEALIAVAQSRGTLADGASDVPEADASPSRAVRAIGARGARPSPQPLQIRRPGLVLSAGAVLANRYLIEAELGRGGLGIVYRAVDRVLGETVAIKMLRPEIVASDPGAFDRLKGELRVTRMLSHRNIVRTHDIGEAQDAPFFTMEYVDGASLATVIHSRGPLARGAVLSVAKQLLRALAVAHDHGVVHGDLKPQNLLIGSGGLLKVTDFGVARLVRSANPSREGAAPESDAGGSAMSRLSGAVLGTPEYMAPEQLIGEPSSARTDIYAAGVVLHECLTGSTPYSADTPVAFVARKLQPDDADSRMAALHVARPSDPLQGIDAVVQAMMNPRVESRPTSAGELLARFAVLV